MSRSCARKFPLLRGGELPLRTMDAGKAYDLLREIFPQIDRRILRAASMEHYDDIDTAVDFILQEVLPNASVDASVSCLETEEIPSERKSLMKDVDNCKYLSPGESTSRDHEDDSNYSHTNSVLRPQEAEMCGLQSVSTPYLKGQGSTSLHRSNGVDISSGTVLGQFQSNAIYPRSITATSVSSDSENRPCGARNNLEAVHSCPRESPFPINDEVSGHIDDEVKTAGSGVYLVEDTHQHVTVSGQPEQFAGTNMLDMLTISRGIKMELLSAVKSVTDMIKEAEFLEEKAKQMKEEISTADSDIIARVQEVKQMLQHAKEANGMQTGIVLGEKSILATEARELQSRLIKLLDERNKYAAVIKEIQQALEVRLATAKKEIEISEKRRLEDGEFSQTLSNLEAQMKAEEEVSRMLRLKDQENSKLREILVERGHVVDALQGEMTVICEDVLLLKEIVDGRQPWSKLLMSSMSSLSCSRNSSLQKSLPSTSDPLQPPRSPTKFVNRINADGAETVEVPLDDWELLKNP